MPLVVDQLLRRIRRDYDERHAKSVLIVAFRSRQDVRRLMVVPPTPVIPRDKDGRIVPIPVPVASGVMSDRIHHARNPGRPAAIVVVSVIGVLARRDDPADRPQITAVDVANHVGWPTGTGGPAFADIDVISPLRTGALAVVTTGLANVLNCRGRCPDRTGRR